MNTPSPRRDHIFISYRRDDARGASGRLYDWLRIGFERKRVFRDVHSLGVGKWRDKIDTALARSAVCVAVVGPRWANADNLPRLHDPGDMVRHELLTALANQTLTLVPTLVEGAQVPVLSELPTELRRLFDDWNAREVTESGWEDDTRRLIAEIAEASGLAVGPDLDTLLRDAGAAMERLGQLESERKLQSDQIERLKGTVADLTRKLAEAGAGAERAHLAEAFAALARGDTLAAEDAFEREYEARQRAVDDERHAMAEAARNVANLAMLRDVSKAVRFYRKALEAQPDYADTARMLGHALMQLGDLKAARDAFARALVLAREQSDPWCEMAAQGAIGDALKAQGDGPGALAAYRKSLTIAEVLATRDPSNIQRPLALALVGDIFIRFVDIHIARGDPRGALAAYRSCLALFKTLGEIEPANVQWQHDIVACQERIGNVLRAQGDGPEALAAYRQCLAIAEAVTKLHPANTAWQNILSVSHIKIGDSLKDQGDGAGALASFRQSMTIAESLAARDPTNTQWQRDLSVCHGRIGDELQAQGDGPGAVAAYRQSLAIREALAVRDPVITQWQRDLSVCNVRIGALLQAQGDVPGALAAYRQSLAIAEALSPLDPANTEWQTDIVFSCAKLGALEHGQSLAARREYLKRGMAILVKLKAEGRLMSNQDWCDWFATQIQQLPT